MNPDNGVQSRADSQEVAVQDIVPCTVFVIEDDRDDRTLAERELRDSEFVKDLVFFRDGKELMDYMTEQGFMDHSVILYTPLLLLVDLEMPRKEGLEIIQELKADPFLEPIPLVVVTGTDSIEKTSWAEKLGAQAVFRKPLSKYMLHHFFQTSWQWPPKELWL